MAEQEKKKNLRWGKDAETASAAGLAASSVASANALQLFVCGQVDFKMIYCDIFTAVVLQCEDLKNLKTRLFFYSPL